MTRLAAILERIESALSNSDPRAVSDAFAEAAQVVPDETVEELHARYLALCELLQVGRISGFVLAALPLIQAFEDAVAASGRFAQTDMDELLMGRATFEAEAGEYAAAIRSAERLLARVDLEPFPSAVATMILGTSYAMVGSPSAVSTLREGVQRIARLDPPDAPMIARAKIELARAVMETEGGVHEAETLAREVLPVLEDGPWVLPAFARDVLGRALMLQGKYEVARAYFEEALAVVRERAGPEHHILAAALANLGMLCFMRGDYLGAERLLEEAYEQIVKSLGPQCPSTIPILLGLMHVRIETGDREGAERLLSRVQSALRARPGDSSPQALAHVLIRLGHWAFLDGDAEVATRHYEESLRLLVGTSFETLPMGALTDLRLQMGDPVGAEEEILRRIEHLAARGLSRSHEGASAWGHLASARLAQGEWRDAITHVDTAISILESTLSPFNPDITPYLETRVCGQLGLRDLAGAAASLDRLRRIDDRQLMDSLAVMPASRRAALLLRLRRSLMFTISVHLDYAPFDRAIEAAARAMLIRRKGISGEAARQRLDALRRRLGSEEQQLLERYSGVLRELSAHVVEPDPRLSETARANLTRTLNEEKEAIECDLPPAVLRSSLDGADPTAAAIASRLAAGEAFIDYVLYRSVDPVSQQLADEAFFGAYWVTSDGGCGATRIGSGAAIVSLVERFHLAIQETDAEALAGAAVEGYRMLIDSLPEPVARAPLLRISPDGALYLLPFVALMREPGVALLQSTTITYVDSARDILAPPPPAPPREHAAVIGDPDYYASTANLREEQAEDVPGGEVEVAALRGVLPHARFWTRAGATKQRLMSLHGPVVLHVITHGAFHGGDAVQDLAMAQSAISLAGYNDADRGIRDGALTGLEASLLDLQGCELVTLSACDTGKGRIDVGQGILGLRRGLQIAGSRSQLVTLWPVVGEATARFMAHFYGGLARSLPREQAMREAQLATAAEFEQWPGYWAPFVLFGARGPIDAGAL